MKKIFYLLILFSSVCFGQGITSVIYVPGQGWVTKKLVDSAWTAAQLANATTTAATTATNAALAAAAPTVNPTFTGTVTLPAATVTNANLAGSIAASKLIGVDIVLAESQVTNLAADLNLKAPLASPTFTGVVTLPALAVTNAMLAGSIAYSKLNLTGAVLAADLAGSIPYSKLTLTGAILNADLAGSIAATKLVGSDIVLPESQVTNLVTDLAAKQGMTVAATAATTGTMTTTFTAAQSVFTITPTGACTFNGAGGTTGQRATFVVTTSGVSSFVLTWGTNFKTTATLATGTTTAKTFCVNFLNVAGIWIETSRTAAM